MLIEVVGWIGAILIVLAYFLVTNKKISPASHKFHLLNLIGAIGVIVNSYFHRAIPGMVLNIVWSAVAIYGIIRSTSKR